MGLGRPEFTLAELVGYEDVEARSYEVLALLVVHDMCTKNISETLSVYSDFVEEMHKWKRLLGW